MEKKYYFRGFGLGIIVTAVIMGIALPGGGKKTMTDDEVIARAKELGMIEDSTLLESEENRQDGQGEVEAAPVQKENAVKKDIAAAEQTEETAEKTDPGKVEPVEGAPESLQEKENKAAEAEESGEAEAKEPEAQKKKEPGKTTEQKSSADTNEMTKQDEDVQQPKTGKAISVTISSGDGSYTVAKKLADAGVVGSAVSYDEFLCANGYDKKLRPGTFDIPEQASEEQIAKIVTGQD